MPTCCLRSGGPRGAVSAWVWKQQGVFVELKQVTLEGCVCGAPGPRPGASAHPGVCVQRMLAADSLTPVGSCLELGTTRGYFEELPCSFTARCLVRVQPL